VVTGQFFLSWIAVEVTLTVTVWQAFPSRPAFSLVCHERPTDNKQNIFSILAQKSQQSIIDTPINLTTRYKNYKKDIIGQDKRNSERDLSDITFKSAFCFLVNPP